MGGHTKGSLRRRLPLVISLLLLATVTALAWVGYREVEAAVLQASHERLRGAARQLANLLNQSVLQRLNESRALAARPVFLQAIRGEEEALREARIALEALVASPQVLRAELWRSTERLVQVVPSQPIEASQVESDPPRASGFAPLQAAGDVVYFDVAIAVPPAPSQATNRAPVTPEGYVMLRRRASTGNTAEVIGRLIGDGVSLRFGSRSGGVWTDLSRVEPAPPPGPAPGGVTAYPSGDGLVHLGIEEAVPGTPWSVWVEIPRHIAIAPARAFWQRMIPLALAVVVLGTILAWWISRWITTPLHVLTRAAEAMASGEFSKRVQADRTDEIGRLGDAFNSMADRVEDGYARLDQGIRERTRELEDTVTALNEAQEQLVRREKLAMLGQLASGVGHELRNPLGVMTNAVYYLELVQPDAEPDVHEYHGLLRAQIGLAEKIVGDLLDFSRIKPPRREKVALSDLVDTQLARLTVADGIKVDREISRDLPPASVDPVQVGQIVFNLLVNAVQAIEGRGGRVLLRGAAANGHLLLAVEDNGPGVAPELREKIFEPLFTTKARGIGLGLAVSRSLAEANGGELTVSQGPNGGALFTLTMPVVQAAAEAMA